MVAGVKITRTSIASTASEIFFFFEFAIDKCIEDCIFSFKGGRSSIAAPFSVGYHRSKDTLTSLRFCVMFPNRVIQRVTHSNPTYPAASAGSAVRIGIGNLKFLQVISHITQILPRKVFKSPYTRGLGFRGWQVDWIHRAASRANRPIRNCRRSFCIEKE